MKTKLVLLLVGIGAAVAVAVVAVAPSLGAASVTETSVTGAAEGTFPSRTSFSKITLSSWAMGMGVVVQSDGSALGDFELTADGTSTSGRSLRVAFVGKAAKGDVKKDGGALFTGTATVDKGDGSAATSLPFSVYATSKGFIQITIGNVSLPSVKLGAGSIFVG